MKHVLAGAAVAAMLLSQTAYAEQGAQSAAFSTPAATPFTASDVAKYNVDADTAAKIEAYQAAGYHVYALTPEQLAQHRAGMSSTTWVIIGVVALVVIVAAASGGGGGGGY